MTRDTWHVTCDMWHVTHEGRWTVLSSYDLGVKVFDQKDDLHHTLSIWLQTQFREPNPELGPLQAEFEPNSINWQKN